MPRAVKSGKSPVPDKILQLSFPDDEAMAFWKATADDPDEVAARVAKFSRALNEGVAAKAVKSPLSRQQGTRTSAEPIRPKVLGKLLIMPTLPRKPAKQVRHSLVRLQKSKRGIQGKNAEEK